MTITERAQRQARTLLARKAAQGNHGFKGIQLEAWRTQRRALRDGLRIIARDGRIGNEAAYAATRSPCPARAISRWVRVYDMRSDWTRTVKNPEWCGGTKPGEKWVYAAADFINAVQGGYFGEQQ